MAEARDPVALVYSWFTEAFALADLEERQALLCGCGLRTPDQGRGRG